jgi:homoserine kinase
MQSPATSSGNVVARRAKAPGSSANLGPGFDTLGLALQLYTEVTIRPADEFSLITTGQGSQLPATPDHFAAKIAAGIIGHHRFAMTVSSDIPMTRGLGSSAAMAVAASAAAGHPDPFSFAATLEGHADNAAAAVLGGLVTGAIVEPGAVGRRLPLDPDLRFVIIVPERHLRTSSARKVLPEMVPMTDVVFQLGRMGLLIAGLADHRLLLPTAAHDRIHQGQRGAALFPEASHLLGAMVRAGALASCWSGAGPTLLAVCLERTAERVRNAATDAMRELGVVGTARRIDADLDGLVLTEL